MNLAPLAVVILDSGGNLVVAKREDGAGILRWSRHAKAWGSLGMGFGSRELAERAQTGPAFISVLAAVSGGKSHPRPAES